MSAHKQYGMTLIELMVALAIGAFLMIGAITVFMQSRATFRITESVSRLQENARFALDVLEPDIRMAHYWGLTTTTASIVNRAAATAPNGPGPDTCGNNWTIDLDQAIAGSNNSYGFACAGTAPVETNADTRHVVDHVGTAVGASDVLEPDDRRTHASIVPAGPGRLQRRS
jgi:type IV pilus assembly protein PilW